MKMEWGFELESLGDAESQSSTCRQLHLDPIHLMGQRIDQYRRNFLKPRLNAAWHCHESHSGQWLTVAAFQISD